MDPYKQEDQGSEASTDSILWAMEGFEPSSADTSLGIFVGSIRRLL